MRTGVLTDILDDVLALTDHAAAMQAKVRALIESPDSVRHLTPRLVEQIFEIRYTPNPTLMDRRGHMTKMLQKHLALNEWQIDANRLDVFNTPDTIRAFVSYRNTGLVVRNAPDPDVFANHAAHLLRAVASGLRLNDRIFVERLGVRIRMVYESTLPFPEMVQRHLDRVGAPAPGILALFGNQVVDVGTPLHIETSNGRLHLSIGPMEQAQIQQAFASDSVTYTAATGWYADLDYFIKPVKNMGIPEITAKTTTLARQSWDQAQEYFALVLG